MTPAVRALVACFLVAVLAAAGGGCGGHGEQAAEPGAGGKGGPGAGGAGGGPAGRGGAGLEYPVEAVPAPVREVEYRVTAVGSIEAFEKVQVTARVPGAVERVLFKEGDAVRAGQPLVEIEPERYRLEVLAAKASLEKAEAARADAEAGLARRESANVTRPGLIKAEDVETFRTRLRVATAEVAEQRAALRQAELNLRDAYVRAPLSGLVETRSVQTGQYVQAGATLATMVQREPLLLRLQVPEQDAAPLRPGMQARVTVPGIEHDFQAVLTHVGGSAEETSRMVSITGRIDDPGRDALRPGAFAQVDIPIGRTSRSPVIPQTAVRPSERGFLVYVIEGGLARERVVTLGMRTAEGDVEVTSGLKPGEMLVVRGAEALRDGVRVKIEPRAGA